MEKIHEIRLFVRVVDLGSFSKAAAEAAIGQPAATKQINRMEQQLGARLLHRTTHGVSPTEIGLLYYEKCKTICHLADEAQSVGTLLQTQAQGAIRISSSVAFGRRVMAPLVMEFMQMNPHLQIELNCEDRYVDLVEQGVDVAIRLGKLADSSLGAGYLGVNPWILVASPAYLKEHGRPKKPADLGKHNCLIYSSVQGDDRWQLSGGDADVASIAVRGRLRSNNLSMLLTAARHNFGIAALPLYVAHKSLESGAIVSLLDQWKLPQQEVHAVFPSPRLVPAKVKLFITWLQGQFGPNWWATIGT
ncbi:LysR substrate-binding domain-containing protein [Limnohabitans sp.]|jgi:DNA-binding transcriptional LysR family regulator|uniref:LysR family transcriptional regulator n=1 Tax=Limnohabitans sp. TaxID=1907725 RepID=UPI0037C031EC